MRATPRPLPTLVLILSLTVALVAAPALPADAAPRAREAYLSFAWAPVGSLDDADLQPAPLRRLLPEEDRAAPWWASTLPSAPAADPSPS